METCPVSYKKNTGNKNSVIKGIKQNGLILLSNYAVCSKKKSRFIKK